MNLFKNLFLAKIKKVRGENCILKHITIDQKKVIILLPLLSSFYFLINYLGITINITPSQRQGIYMREDSELRRGDSVLVCVPSSYSKLGLERGYLLKGTQCKSSSPLLKTIIALPGDNVFLTHKYIMVNNDIYFYRTINQDKKGRILPIFPQRMYFKTQGYWVLGTNAANSWDSRYWGPIGKKYLVRKVQPIL